MSCSSQATFTYNYFEFQETLATEWNSVCGVSHTDEKYFQIQIIILRYPGSSHGNRPVGLHCWLTGWKLYVRKYGGQVRTKTLAVIRHPSLLNIRAGWGLQLLHVRYLLLLRHQVILHTPSNILLIQKALNLGPKLIN